MKNKPISTERIQKAASQSSRLEGLSFLAAKKNKKLIQVLKTYGRAFAISRQR